MHDPYKQQYQYLLQLEQRMLHLEAAKQLLEQETLKLKEQLEQIKPIHIENINYKIQELTVRDLHGTLNIGLSALTDEEQLKKIMADVEQGRDIHLEDLSKSPGLGEPEFKD